MDKLFTQLMQSKARVMLMVDGRDYIAKIRHDKIGEKKLVGKQAEVIEALSRLLEELCKA